MQLLSKICIPQRFFIMFLICVYILTGYSQISNPESMQHDLTRMLHMTSGQYSGLFSVASWVSLTDVAHGYIIERWLGLKLATAIYCAIALLGNAIYILGGFARSFWFMVIGRAVFGFGANPVYLCMSCFILHWFEGKEINLMFSLTESVVWLSTSLNYFTVVRILYYIKSFPHMKQNEALAITICCVTILMSILIVLSSGTIAVLYKKKNEPIIEKGKVTESLKEKSIKSLLTFKPIFWAFLFSYFLFEASLNGFMVMSQEFFKTKFDVNVEAASDWSSLLSLIGFAVTPFIGYIVDQFGRQLVFFAASVIIGICSMAIFSYTIVWPIIPVILWSFVISVSSCSYSMFQYFVDEDQYTVAYGVAQTMCQMSIIFGSMSAGYVVDSFGFHALPEYFFIILICTAVLTALTFYLDLKEGGLTTISAKERRARDMFKSKSFESNFTSAESTPPTERANKIGYPE